MAIKVLALASGVTGLGDHRILNGALLTSDGQLAVRGGVLPGATSGALSTVSAMVARVAPVKVAIPNGVSAALGPYVLVSDANVDITFDNGEAAVPRVDRIIARAYDDTNDGSGSTMGSIYYLKGTAGGSATALPTNSILLYEMTVPAGASAGGGGINFANAVDRRVYTVAQGGIIPVADATEMAAMVANLYEGMTLYRMDLDTIYVGAGANFYPRGQISVANFAGLAAITNPYDGLIATSRDNDAIYVYNGSAWTAPKHFFKPIGRCEQTVAQTSLTDATPFAVTFTTEAYDTHSFHSTGSNQSRVTPTIAGYYRVNGTVTFQGQNDYVGTDAYIRKNGTDSLPGATRIGYAGSNTTVSIPATAIVQANGSTDYFELMGRADRSGNATSATAVSAFLASTLEWEYLGPTAY